MKRNTDHLWHSCQITHGLQTMSGTSVFQFHSKSNTVHYCLLCTHSLLPDMQKIWLQVGAWRCCGRIPLSVDVYASLRDIQKRWSHPFQSNVSRFAACDSHRSLHPHIIIFLLSLDMNLGPEVSYLMSDEHLKV